MTLGLRQQILAWCHKAGQHYGTTQPLVLEAVALFAGVLTDTTEPGAYEPTLDLYDVARQTCHNHGIAWVDPRTGWRYPAPAPPVRPERRLMGQAARQHYDACGLCGDGVLCEVGRSLLVPVRGDGPADT